MKKTFTYFLSGLFVLFSNTVQAQWSTNSAINNSICTATGDATWNVNGFKIPPTIISDGAGGAIITWVDERSGTTNKDIYAQRINAAGVIQWTSNGVAICTSTGNQQEPVIVSDGAGGAIISWMDNRGVYWDLYTQHINATGMVQWTSNGVAISTASGGQTDPAIISDGLGGAIISWTDSRNDGFADIYSQRINATGTVQWTANGVAICTKAGSNQTNSIICADGMGGAFIVWEDYRGADHDIYTQYLNANGALQWVTDGIGLCIATGTQNHPAIVSDGAGGAIVTWWDLRNGVSWKIYAHRLLTSGASQWTANGVEQSTATGQQTYPTIIADGSGGAIISWKDDRNGTNNNDIYAQHVNAAGIIQWTGTGIAVCISAGHQENPALVSDGSGGAIISWHNGFAAASNDIYAQRIDAAGIAQWATNGIVISSATGFQERTTLISDGLGGAIITWQDRRNINDYDIYAQNICSNGIIGGASCGVLPVELISFKGQINTAGQAIDLFWVTSNETNTAFFEIEKSEDGIHFYTLGKEVAGGNSSMKKSYTYTDATPFKGNNFYKLKTIDIDGKTSFSKIINISSPNAVKEEWVFPNPTAGKLNIQSTVLYKNATIKILNTIGQVIEQKVNVNGPNSSFDMTKYEPGVYRVIISENNLTRTFMIIKN